MLAIVLGAGFGAYTLLKPPFWETGNPLLADANGGPINLLDDLDTNPVQPPDRACSAPSMPRPLCHRSCTPV